MKGSSGSGKTRLLQESAHQLSLHNISIIYMDAQVYVGVLFQKEMSDFGIDLKTCTGCDAIFKFVLYRHVVLLVYLSRTEAQGRVVEKPTFVPLVA